MIKQKYKGFSLIELVVVLAIIAIITAVAVPSYRGSVRRSACDAGKAGLIEVDSVMNKNYLKYSTYKNVETYPSFRITQIPVSGEAIFTVAVVVTDTTYTITLTPAITSVLNGYGSMTIDQAGTKLGTGALSNVWTQGCSI